MKIAPLISPEDLAWPIDQLPGLLRDVWLPQGIHAALWRTESGADNSIWITQDARARRISPGRHARWCPDGSIAVLVDPCTVECYDLKLRIRKRWELPTQHFVTMEISPNGQYVALISEQPGTLKLVVLDLESGRHQELLEELKQAELAWRDNTNITVFGREGRLMEVNVQNLCVQELAPTGDWRTIGWPSSDRGFLLGQPDFVERLVSGCALFGLRPGTPPARLSAPDDDIDPGPGIAFFDRDPIVCVARRDGFHAQQYRDQKAIDLGPIGQLGRIHSLATQRTTTGSWITLATGASAQKAFDWGSSTKRPPSNLQPWMRHLVVPTRDGIELDAWLHLPRTRGQLALVVLLHGGPRGQSGPWLDEDIESLLANGLAVLAPNPRGSSGRGVPYARALIDAGPGDADIDDVQACLDAALAIEPRITAGRIGVSGLSYGSLIACGLAQRNDRISSVVLDRPIGCWNRFRHTARNGVAFVETYFRGDEAQAEAVCPAHAFAPNLHAPVRIVIAGNDALCPPEQVQPLIEELVRLQRNPDVIRINGADHGLPMTGHFDHRQVRLEGMTAWHRQHLQVTALHQRSRP